MRDVQASNHARIRTHVDPRSGHVLVFATIDNLWKGTSSQAVQALNVAFGRDEGEGLGG
jgi:N-acetyl-gamma-glutamyl-phosphate reductase